MEDLLDRVNVLVEETDPKNTNPSDEFVKHVEQAGKQLAEVSDKLKKKNKLQLADPNPASAQALNLASQIRVHIRQAENHAKLAQDVLDDEISRRKLQKTAIEERRNLLTQLSSSIYKFKKEIQHIPRTQQQNFDKNNLLSLSPARSDQFATTQATPESEIQIQLEMKNFDKKQAQLNDLLDTLGQAVQRIKDHADAINQQMTSQNELLSSIENRIDQNSEKLNVLKAKTSETLKKASTEERVCVNAVLILVFLVIFWRENRNGKRILLCNCFSFNSYIYVNSNNIELFFIKRKMVSN
eukprot:c18638_g1_i2.p1 GENE.c18638_g1_i2~~c18638_g1_i2.p1  ORF type:complete len:314 (+),score=102.96 c18638_g1_i2:50-943(+)